jgi:predicted metalloendopeptidase
MNLTRIEERGITPLLPYLRKIDAIKTKVDLDTVLVFLMLWRIHPLISFAVDSGVRNSSVNILTLQAPSLLYPQQQYTGWPVPTDAWWETPGFELRDIPGMANDHRLTARLRAAQYYKRLNELAGYPPRHAEAAAVQALWVETELATWVRQDRPDPDPAGPEPVDLAALEAAYGGLPWRGFLQAAARKCARRGLRCAGALLDGAPRAAVQAPAFYARASAALAAWPPERWIPFLRTSAIRALAPYLGAAFGAAGLAPAAEVQGVRALPPRRAACVRAATAALPGLSDRLYVRRYLPPAAEAAGAEVLRYVREAFVARVAAAPWMDGATARLALAKARAMGVHLGGPAGSGAPALEGGPADPRDFFGNAQRADRAAVLRRLRLLEEPADRSRWPLVATSANAAYSERRNAVFLPAALLRPPLFGPALDMARNFGGVGAVVGHEMTHGFDSAGRRYDAEGEYAAWWDAASEARFLDGAACLRRLYGGFRIAGVGVAARRVLREAIADAGGAAVALGAYRAWHRAAHLGAPPPAAGERLFFAAFGQLWCDRGRRAHVRLEARGGDHAPGVFRCNGVASQSADFAAAFACRPGSPMNPPDKCAVW